VVSPTPWPLAARGRRRDAAVDHTDRRALPGMGGPAVVPAAAGEGRARGADAGCAARWLRRAGRQPHMTNLHRSTPHRTPGWPDPMSPPARGDGSLNVSSERRRHRTDAGGPRRCSTTPPSSAVGRRSPHGWTTTPSWPVGQKSSRTWLGSQPSPISSPSGLRSSPIHRAALVVIGATLEASGSIRCQRGPDAPLWCGAVQQGARNPREPGVSRHRLRRRAASNMRTISMVRARLSSRSDQRRPERGHVSWRRHALNPVLPVSPGSLAVSS